MALPLPVRAGRRGGALLPAVLLAVAALLALTSLLEVSGPAFEHGGVQAPIVVEDAAGDVKVDAGSLRQSPHPHMHLVIEVLVGCAIGSLMAVSAVKQGLTEGPKARRMLAELTKALKLPFFVVLWYFFNVQYNIQNKRLLHVFSATWAVSWFQLASGIPIACLMWLLGIVRVPRVSRADVRKLVPVGVAFAGGQVCTVASLGSVAVSFTHVVKALEPAVNAIGSALVLGQVFHPLVYASLLPVFLGVAMASSSELSFTWYGFATAMLSNFFFVTRNIFATKFGSIGEMGTDKTERKTNQLAVLNIVATLVLLPVALVLPGGLLSVPAAWNEAQARGVSPGHLLHLIVASGFHFYMYQLSSFWVLSQVQPITHSVLNTLKRVVIIVVAILVFRTPVSALSAAGTATAIFGVLLYSLTKARLSKGGGGGD